MVVLSSFVVSQGRQSTITDKDDHVPPTASVPLGGTRPHDEESTSRDRWRLAEGYSPRVTNFALLERARTRRRATDLNF
jgi:hypothetical protein